MALRKDPLIIREKSLVFGYMQQYCWKKNNCRAIIIDFLCFNYYSTSIQINNNKLKFIENCKIQLSNNNEWTISIDHTSNQQASLPNIYIGIKGIRKINVGKTVIHRLAVGDGDRFMTSYSYSSQNPYHDYSRIFHGKKKITINLQQNTESDGKLSYKVDATVNATVFKIRPGQYKAYLHGDKGICVTFLDKKRQIVLNH